MESGELLTGINSLPGKSDSSVFFFCNTEETGDSQGEQSDLIFKL